MGSQHWLPASVAEWHNAVEAFGGSALVIIAMVGTLNGDVYGVVSYHIEECKRCSLQTRCVTAGFETTLYVPFAEPSGSDLITWSLREDSASLEINED